jgi:cytochrome b involved in lipid metabolism
VCDDKWIVVDGLVYDVSRFHKIHPGGARIISHFAGQDASVCLMHSFFCFFLHTVPQKKCLLEMSVLQEVWHAMHIDKAKVAKFMKPLLVGRVDEPMNKEVFLITCTYFPLSLLIVFTCF